MDNAPHLQRLLDNAERLAIVSDRICMQQEIDLREARNAHAATEHMLHDLREWHLQSRWKKIKAILL